MTNQVFEPEEAYRLFKQRIEIESTFDVLVNTLGSDKTYLQDRESIDGYMFMLFLALYAHSSVLNRLREPDMIGRYSVADVLIQLSKAY